MNEEIIEFKLENFSGPIELLYAMIKEAKINIYDIPIAKITEQFIDIISNSKLSVDKLSDFHLMAARLLYIKSQILLPIETDIDDDYIDPRDELTQMILDFAKYQKYTDMLMNNEGMGNIYFQRNKSQFRLPFDDEDLWQDVNLDILLKTYSDLLKRLPSDKIFNIKEDVTVEGKRTYLREILEERDELNFLDLVVDLNSYLDIICSFIAVLEAAYAREIDVRQDENFKDIILYKVFGSDSNDYSDEEDEEDFSDYDGAGIDE